MAPIRNSSIRRKVSGLGRRETVSEDDSDFDLEWAYTKEEVKLVKEKLLRQKVNVHRQRSSDGCTRLHLAAKQGREEYLIMLLDFPDVIQDISKENHDGDTIVHLAAEGGYCNILKLLQKKVHPDLDIFMRLNKIGRTPLHKAAGKGKLDAVEYLFQLGAPIDVSDYSGNTALHLAAKSGCINVIRFLVEKRAYFFSTNNTREWPLDLMDTPTIQTLLSDWNFYYSHLNSRHIMEERNGNGVTILHYIAAYATDDVIDYVVENMAQEVRKDMINIKDNNGMTPVHWAAQKQKDSGVVKTLAKHKMDLQGEDNMRSTPLTLALIHQNLSFAEALLNFLGTRLTHEQWTKNWDDKVKETLMASDHCYLRFREAYAQLRCHKRHEIYQRGEELIYGFPHFKMPDCVKELLDGIPVIWTALYAGGEGIAKLIQNSNKDAVNQKDEIGNLGQLCIGQRFYSKGMLYLASVEERSSKNTC